MKKYLVVFFLGFISILFIPLHSDATFIQYDLISGGDSLGNTMSGFVFINDSPVIINNGSALYDIGHFKFISDGGSNIGDQGYIHIEGAAPSTNPNAHANPNMSTASFTGNYFWSNVGAGVFFFDDINAPLDLFPPASDYLTLHEYIEILAVNWINYDDYSWNPAGPFILQRHDDAHVPEPSTMLLLASGLVGLAGLRGKFRK